ncbi:hypothetical protein Tco_1249805 [Tanacetum coccineum]
MKHAEDNISKTEVKRPELERNLSSSYGINVEHGIQQTARNQKSSGKQNLSTHYRGKRKSRDVKKPEQKKRVQREAIIGMVRGDTSRKRPREQSKQQASNEIPFPSMPGCQLVDSPIILEALIKGPKQRQSLKNPGHHSLARSATRSGPSTLTLLWESPESSGLFQWNLRSLKAIPPITSY